MSEQNVAASTWLVGFIQRAWQNQVFRYLVTGGVNTASAYGVFAICYFFLSAHVHYMVVLAGVTVINVTISYVNYKLFVFRTSGNYLREYLRFYGVYAVPIGLGFVLFPLGVEVLHLNAYLVQALNTIITIVLSYLGHKHVSFKPARP